MAKTAKKSGSAKKFGTRYGRTSREKYGRIDALQKADYPCPYCKYVKVKRVNTGIWQCQKCGEKFASKAYYVPKSRPVIVSPEFQDENLADTE